MKERLLKFINSIGLSSSRFAEEIGIQPSGVSHILSGRNNPSYDFIVKILSKFPDLNPDWLILGKGEMFRTGSGKIDTISELKGEPDLFDENVTIVKSEDPFEYQVKKFDSSKTVVSPEKESAERIVFFFKNGQFREFFPG